MKNNTYNEYEVFVMGVVLSLIFLIIGLSFGYIFAYARTQSVVNDCYWIMGYVEAMNIT